MFYRGEGTSPTWHHVVFVILLFGLLLYGLIENGWF